MSSDKKFAANKATDSVAGLRFLVVDDHKFSRHITIEALKWLNATKIDEAQDASEAIALLQGAASMDRKSLASNALAKRLELSDDRLFGQGKFDCVITDFNMSPLNGLHLLKAIRTGDAKCARDTPVLMLTGFSDDYLIASALNLDVNAFVLKPISRVAFNEKLGRVLMRPVEPQSAEVYRDVEIPECDDLNNFPGEPDTDTDQETTSNDGSIVVDEFADRPVRSVKLTDISNMDEDEKVILGEDIVLGEDVEGPSGNILIHRGTRLTGLLLEKLVELNEIGMMSEDIKIFR
jgi:CheY-like chemotaxis protein